LFGTTKSILSSILGHTVLVIAVFYGLIETVAGILLSMFSPERRVFREDRYC